MASAAEQLAQNLNFSAFSKATELKKRIWFTLGALLIYRLDPVTVDALLAAGIIRRARDGVRLLGQGDLKTKLTIEVTGASAGGVKAVEKAGGTVSIVEMPKREAKPKPPDSKGKTRPAAKAKSPDKPVDKTSGKTSPKSSSKIAKKDS